MTRRRSRRFVAAARARSQRRGVLLGAAARRVPRSLPPRSLPGANAAATTAAAPAAGRARRRLPAHGARAALLRDHAHLSPRSARRHSMLLDAQDIVHHAARRSRPGRPPRARCIAARGRARDPDDGPARLPAPLGPRRRRRHRRLAAHAGEEGARRRCAAPATRRRQDRGQAHRVHATARWAARSTRSSRTASGCARSRCSIRRSTSARTAPRARRCASTATASSACATR